MTARTTNFPPHHPGGAGATRRAGRARGFSFTEVLFAVVILGVGFILIAAIFPVAIQQTRATVEESTGSAMAASAVVQLEAVVASEMVPTDLYRIADPMKAPAPVPANSSITLPGCVLSFNDSRLPTAQRNALWNAVAGSLINTADPRMAFIPLYKRDGIYRNNSGTASTTADTANVTHTGSSSAQLILIPVQSRIRPQYNRSTDLTGTGSPFTPASVWVKTAENRSYPDTVQFFNAPTGTPVDAPAAVEGALIVISDDRATGAANGRVYRLGARRTDLGTGVWELQIGADMTFINPDNPATGPDESQTLGDANEVHEQLPVRPVQATNTYPLPGNAALGLLIGRTLQNPAAAYNASTNPYEGASQVVSHYVTFLAVP